jgi:hypothetical protein
MVSRKLLQCKEGSRSCVVFCRGWPCWVWAALGRGFKVQLTIVNNILWKPLILKISPSTEVLAWGQGLTFQCPGVMTVFSDYDLTGRLSEIWSHVSELVILSRAARNLPQGWKHLKLSMDHVDFGGVTDGSWVRHIYTPIAAPLCSISLQARRDARVILDSLANSGCPCKPPENIPVSDKPQVFVIRHDVYHGHGLLPWKTWAPRVITPNIYSKSKWCCRNITTDERLLSRDLTKTQITQLSNTQIKVLLGDE